MGAVVVRKRAHPTAAVRFRLPVARMIEDASAATTVAPSRLHRMSQFERAAQNIGRGYLMSYQMG